MAKVLPFMLAVSWVFSGPAQSEVTVRRDDLSIQIFITGKISSKDAEIVQRALSAGINERIRMTFLSSVGGSVEAAIIIGQSLRDEMFHTTVKRGSKCASACVLILAAGVNRDLEDGSVVAIHRPTYEPNYFAGLSPAEARSKYTQMAKNVRDYLSRMGISDRLFERMMAVPSHEARVLSSRELAEFGLSGLDPVHEERRRAEDIVNFGPEYVRRRDEYDVRMQRYGARCMSMGKTQWQCMIEYSRIEPYPQPKPDFSQQGSPVR
jgi:hypothetical protein